jgi:hypothetical protein
MPGMPRRDRVLLLGLALVVCVLALAPLGAVHDDVLLAAPALLFALPLLAGRYVGEDRLARLAAAFAPGRRRPVRARPPARRPAPRVLPRGGRLIAAALAERPPPARASAA